MRIIYTLHAKERIKQRRISTKDISRAILNPQYEVIRVDGSSVLHKDGREGTLEIICKKSHTTCVIITVYYL